jgi:glycosyltransferase involved in cell wall biosynthesis
VPFRHPSYPGMKRIAHYYENVLDVGGVERYLLSFLQYADRERYHFILVARGSPRFESNLGNLPVQRTALPPRHPLHPGNVIDLWKLLRSEKIDLLHVHSPSASIAGRFAAALRGIPVVYSIHLPSRWYHGKNGTLRARIGRVFYIALDSFLNFTFTSSLLYPSKIVLQSEHRSRHTPKGRSEYIPNSVDLQSFQSLPEREPIRKALNLLTGQVAIVFIGRLDMQKGLDILVSALQHLPATVYPWVLWVVGDGPQDTELHSQVMQAGLEKNVRFFGYHADVRPYLAAADIFVLPSRYDTMPLALLEAFAVGLPCVVSAVGDLAEVVQDEVNGLVVFPEDPTMLSSAIQQLLEKPELRRKMGEAARLRATEFDARDMTERVMAVYARLLNRHST